MRVDGEGITKDTNTRNEDSLMKLQYLHHKLHNFFNFAICFFTALQHQLRNLFSDYCNYYGNAF